MTPTFIVCHAPFRGLFGYVAAHFFFAAALRFQGITRVFYPYYAFPRITDPNNVTLSAPLSNYCKYFVLMQSWMDSVISQIQSYFVELAHV